MFGKWNKLITGFAIAGSVMFYVSCGGSGSPAAESLDTISTALVTPVAGGSTTRWVLDRDGIPRRSDASRAACETIATTRRMREMVRMPREMLCAFGKMQTGGVIARPTGNSTYNYYQFVFAGRPGGGGGGTFKLRFGNDASGNLSASFCFGARERAGANVELINAEDAATGKTTITVTNSFTPPGASAAGTGQLKVTAKHGDKYEFEKATMKMGGSAGAHSNAASVEKSGTKIIVKESFSGAFLGRPTFTHKLYSEFTETEGTDGSSKCSHSGVGGGVEWVDSWTNSSTYACEHPKTSGDNYATVNAFDLTTLDDPSTPSFSEEYWSDCTPPSGKSFTSISNQDIGQTLGQSIGECFTEHGTALTDPGCHSNGADQCDS